MKTGIWADLAPDLAAAGWSVGLVAALAAWLRTPVALWLLLAAYALTALATRKSRSLGYAALAIGAAAAWVAGGHAEPAVRMLAAAAVSSRALSLVRPALRESLRAEVRRGVAIMIGVSILRLGLGSPAWTVLALPALMIVLAGAFGLPYVQLMGSPSGAHGKALESSLRFGGLVLLVAAACTALVGLLILLQRAGAYAAGVYALYHLLAPILAAVVGLLTRVRPRPGESPQLHPLNPRLHGHAAGAISPHDLFWTHFVLATLALAVAVGLYQLLRRHRPRAFAAPLDEEHTAPVEEDLQEAAPWRRSRPGFGSGPRAVVRAMVARHVERGHALRGDTARRVAVREDWPGEVLGTYEEARYRLREPLEEQRARGFVAAFGAWRRGRAADKRGGRRL